MIDPGFSGKHPQQTSGVALTEGRTIRDMQEGMERPMQIDSSWTQADVEEYKRTGIRPRGAGTGIIHCDEFGRPFGEPYVPDVEADKKTPRGLVTSVHYIDDNAFPQNQGQTMTTPEADVQHSPFINGVPPTIVEVDPAPPGWYEERERISQQERAAELAKVQAQVTAMNEACEAAGVNPISVAFRALVNVMQSDPSYAWTWHCNMAMPIHDEGVTPRTANLAAARIMRHVFEVDTMTQVQSDFDAAKPKEA